MLFSLLLAFHYGFLRFFSGGFVGVDVFFVISGFLITKIIYDGFDGGKYSIVNFYDRRVRRIFPALFLMFFAIFVASYIMQFPSEVKYLGNSIISSIFFVSNILFYNSASYFDQTLFIKPSFAYMVTFSRGTVLYFISYNNVPFATFLSAMEEKHFNSSDNFVICVRGCSNL